MCNTRKLARKYKLVLNLLGITLIFYKQLGSGPGPQSCLYFQGFWAQSYFMVDQQFDQVTFAGKEYNNFEDSKSVFMISDFRIFPIMLWKQLSFGEQLFYVYYKVKTPLLFNLEFLLFLREGVLSAESSLAICHPWASL